jgi:hypothetical protein
MKLAFSRQNFEKSSNISFHENTSSGSRVVSCGRTHTTTLIVAFRYCENAPKKEHLYYTQSTTTLPPQSTATWTLQQTQQSAVHIRLIMRMADKTGASLFLPIRNGTPHRHICRRWRRKWILRINAWGKTHLICRLYIKNAITTGNKKKYQHVIFNTKAGGTFNATCGQRVPIGTFPFLLKKRWEMYV